MAGRQKEVMCMDDNTHICLKCQVPIADTFAYCPHCGKKQGAARRSTRRANGSGSIYRDGSSWRAAKTIRTYITEDGHLIQQRIKRRGFPTKKAAAEWLASITANHIACAPITLEGVFSRWEAGYSGRVGQSTMAGYRAAWGHLSAIKSRPVDSVTASDLQECIDKCGQGKRTKQMIKVLANLLFKWALDNRMIVVNPAANLYTGSDATTTRAPITDAELERIAASGRPYADYVVCMCYLGFRPSEFFRLRKEDYHQEGSIHYLIQGSKTEAGKDRRVTIPPRILPLIRARLNVEETAYIFPRMMKDGSMVEMDQAYFREWIFKPLMSSLGIEGKLPYGTRHTYSNKLGDALGADKDKAALIGHANYSTTKRYYQSSDLEHMDRITAQMQ